MLRTSLVVVLLAGALSRAIADGDTADEHEPPHIKTAILESAVLIGIVAAMYEANVEAQRSDFDLSWDWPSWRRKLSFDAVRFDTNRFSVNAVRHPLMSIVQYQIGRTNNLGMFGSEILATASAVVWEFIVEYREYPSLNDLVINATTGLQIGEPLWQIGQLWRGGVLSVGDRVKTALFSPLDAAHDLARRRYFSWWRPAVWRSIAIDGGVLHRFDGDETRGNLVIGGDIDVVADKRYISPGPQTGAIKAGSWSRIRGRLEIGNNGGDTEIVGARVTSRTAFAGRYTQQDNGQGVFLGIGTAFSYHRNRLAYHEWDHYAIAHIVGPQYQLSYRTPAFALRWDAAAYGDFALIDAHAVGPISPFPAGPPLTSSLQTEGYYNGLGASAMTRLRLDGVQWSFDAELACHRIWQIDQRDRAEPPPARTLEVHDPHGASDTRLSWRTQLTYRLGQFGLAATVEGDARRASWQGVERVDSGISFGLLGHVDL